MKFMNIFAGCFVLALAACGQNQTTIKDVSGTLVLGHEVRSFTPEGSSQNYWIIDKTGNLMNEYRKVTGSSIINGKPVYALLTVEDICKHSDGFGTDYDGTYNVLKIISLSTHPVSLTGSWVEPVPGMENMVQGFSLEENGKASSVNMATLQYEKWQSSGKQLVLSGKSIGNHQTIDFTTTYEIKELSPQKLVLEKDNQVFTFRRQEN